MTVIISLSAGIPRNSWLIGRQGSPRIANQYIEFQFQYLIVWIVVNAIYVM